MSRIFTEQDRQDVFEYIFSTTQQCDKIISLVQVGSGAYGYHDERSDLDFVIALDSDESMLEVMEYMHRKLSEKYELLYFKQVEAAHLQVYVLSDMLEIDIGFGWYEHAAARKPAFKVLFDRSGVVEEKMVKSLEWMDDSIYGGKLQKDRETAGDTVWAHLMHSAVAIKRGELFRVMGELDYVRGQYIELLGDRYRLETAFGRETDRLPDEEKAAIKSTLVTGESAEELWACLLRLTDLVYKELDGFEPPVTKEMLYEYYKGCKNEH